MTKVFNRADFLAAVKNSYKRELVEIPELGGAVYISELSAERVIAYNERLQALKKDGSEITPATSLELMALLISMAVCDEAGDPLFTEGDVKTLRRTNPVVLMTLSAKVLEVSGISNAAVDEVTSQLKNAVSDSSATT